MLEIGCGTGSTVYPILEVQEYKKIDKHAKHVFLYKVHGEPSKAYYDGLHQELLFLVFL